MNTTPAATFTFTKTAREGRYQVTATYTKTGHTARVLVQKKDILNASARGGAYTTEWVASLGISDTAHAPTRQAAVQALAAALGDTVTFA